MISKDFFSFPNLQQQNTPSFTGTTQQIFSEAVTFIFQDELERTPTASEISQYSSIIQNNFVGYTSTGTALFDYQPAMQSVANLQETTEKIQSAFQNNLGDTASNSIISDAESDLGKGVSFSSLRTAIIGSNAEQSVLNSLYQSVLGRPIEDSALTGNEQALANGGSLQAIRSTAAYSQEAQNDLNTIYQSVLGRPIEDSALTGNEQALANGGSLQAIRSTAAYSQEAQNDLNTIYQSVLGRPIEDSALTGNEQALANGGSLQAIRSTAAYSQEAQNDLSNIYQSVLGRPIDNEGLTANEQVLANGSSLQDVRSKTAYSQEAQNDLSNIYQSVLGRPIDNEGLTANEQVLANGSSLQDVRSKTAYSQEAQNDLSNIYQSVLGRPIDNEGLTANEQVLANGSSLQDVRSKTAYSGEDRESLSSDIQFIFGRSAGDSEISGYESQLSGNWSRSQTLLSFVSSSEFQNITRNVYADWGQLPPTDDQLKTAGQAMFNLHASWIIAKDQTTDQLQAEASGYQILSANSSFQDYIDNIAGSADQARDLEASMLADPLMEQADNVQDARTLLSQGGGPVEGAMVDQGVMKTVIQQDKENPLTPCDDVSAFRDAHTQVVYNTPQITSANAQWQTVNQRDWSASYVANGVVWNEDRGGAGASAQGLPYEAYVQEKLNGGNPTGDYVWLQDHRSNWMTFDHWNKNTGDAVSDKALNTNRDMYKTDPANIKYRIWADMKEMAMKYTESRSRQGTAQPIRFTQEDIQTYTFELGVRAATTTDAQWKQICEAYRGADAKMASYERNGYKPLDFEIDAILDAVS